MIPSVLARHVRRGVEDFLRTTFPVSTPLFRGVLDRLLAEDGEVFKGPYLSIQLPFLGGQGTAEPFPDVPLRFPPHRHQEQAFARLRGPRPRSTIVASGTGSGKTECFLYPILDHCYQSRDQRGIKAILIYPMNALATDQAQRLARLVWDSPQLKGNVTAGLLIGQKGKDERRAMGADDIITSRETLRLSPPDILLTNYKMLDYLLVRPRDSVLWQHNGPETLRYLVVDELHTFDGAQGTDLACLIRRLKARLKSPGGFLCCVGTSATLGGEDEAALCEYATTVFAEEFDASSVITESRQTAGEFLAESLIERLDVVGHDLAGALEPDSYEDYPAYVRGQHGLWFDALPEGSFDDPGWRLALGEKLKGHYFFQNLLKVLGGQARPFPAVLAELDKRTQGLAGASEAYRANLLVSLLSLVSEARVQVETAAGQTRLAPFLNVRLQVWLRELRRMVSEVAREPRLRFADDLTDEQLARHAAPVHCRECGAMGWAGMRRQHDSRLDTDLRAFYVGHFASQPSPNVTYVFPDSAPATVQAELGATGRICTRCLVLHSRTDEACTSCGQGDLIDVLVPEDRIKRGGRMVGTHRCPYCSAPDGLTVLGSRSASLTAVLIAQLLSSRYNDDKKLLTFSDSVQDAAYRAGFFGTRTYRFSFRAALQQFVEDGGEGLDLAALPKAFCEHYAGRMDELEFLATFLPPDMAWLEDYEHLLAKGHLPDGSHLRRDAERRVEWEVLSEYGFRARIGRTLEKTSSSVAHVDPERLGSVGSKLLTVLQNEIEALRDLDAPALERFLNGMLVHLKDEGGVLHSVFRRYIEGRGNTWTFGRQIHWMPRFGAHGRAPAFLCSGSIERFDRLLSPSPTHRTWHQAWAEKCFGHLDAFVRHETDRLYEVVLKVLVGGHILEEHSAGRDRVWGLQPEALRVSSGVVQLRCSVCDHNASVAAVQSGLWADMPCLRIHCHGRYRFPENSPATASQPSEAGDGNRAGEQPRDYYGKLYSDGDIVRLFSEEHTGLLTREEREELEQRFKAPPELRKPWYPNLLSSTPTLEMGIDIGDLSSLILCSVPPAQANYLQRIGRAGRRDGNALNLTVAAARPHDLYFFAAPEEMISGRVEPPGVFLHAPAVLERQFTAWCFDRWVETGVAVDAIPDRMSAVLTSLQPVDPGRFPHNLLQFIDLHRTELLDGFLERFDLVGESETADALRTFAEGDQGQQAGLAYRILEALQRKKRERDDLTNKVKLLRERIKAKEAEVARSQQHQEELLDLVRERSALQRLARAIGDTNVLNFFTDEGLLPNYAFPEAGVVLKSIVYRKRAQPQEGEGQYEIRNYTYERAAASAIHELAPENVFYAGKRRVKVDQVDIAQSQIENWRLCRECAYTELEGTREPLQTCPRCGDPLWSDEGQRRTMLRMRQVLATTSERDSRITDDSDDREPSFYNRQMLVDFEERDVLQAWRVDSDEMPFGFELLSRCVFREINFGEKGDIGTEVRVAGVEMPRHGFLLCRHCGKVQPRFAPRGQRSQIQHALTCTARDRDSEAALIECVYLYREFSSEAIRILLPVPTFSGSERNLHSFIAALHLGLRRRFRGNIDHLQSAVHEEPDPSSGLRKQYLVLHDTVPGGTGYLKQLMRTPDDLMAVFQAALDTMTACSCASDPSRDGCYRCLFAYRHSYDMKQTSRKTAVELLQGILAHRADLKVTDTLRKVRMDGVFESTLEAMFVEALRRLKVDGAPSVVRKELVRGNAGFYVRLGERAWYLERQVPLGPADGVSVPCRADFVFRPARARDDVKPIAVFTDGFQFHRDRVGADLAQRMALVRSGRFHVWSLTYKDVEEGTRKHRNHFVDFLDVQSTPAGGQFARFAEHFRAAGLRPANGEGSFEWLARYLADPDAELWTRYAFVHGQMFIEAQRFSAASDRAQWRARLAETLPEEMAGAVADASDEALLGWVERPGAGSSEPVRLLVRVNPSDVAEQRPAGLWMGGLLEDGEDSVASSGYDRLWNGFLRLYNLFQFLPGTFLVSRSGLDKHLYGAIPIEVPVWAPGPAVAHSAWQGVLEETDPELHDFLRHLVAAGCPAPEIPPYELTDGGGVVGEAELAWPGALLALLDDAQEGSRERFESKDWMVLKLNEMRERPEEVANLLQSRGGDE